MSTNIKAASAATSQVADLSARANRNAGTGAAGPAAAGAAAGSGRMSDDSVALTGTASLLRNAASKLHGVPVVNGQRVEQLRNAIANGSYQVDAQRVADKLIGMEKTLGKSGG